MKNFFAILVLSLLLGCFPPGETTGGLQKYQYSAVESMVDDKYWIKGWDSEDAMTGAKAHCSKVGGSFQIVKMKPGTDTKRATLTFKCQTNL